MTRIKYFQLEESPYHPNHYIIVPNFAELPPMSTEGSYNILGARLMNLSYADYLRFCRDIVGAEIMGKDTRYPVPYFVKSNETRAFVDLLSARMNLVMWERVHPNWREHQEYLKQKKGIANGTENNE